jgi:hypothetical protein
MTTDARLPSNEIHVAIDATARACGASQWMC